MQKREFINRLNLFPCNLNQKARWRGQEIFVRFLVEYFQTLDLSVHEKYDFWHIEPYLPELLVTACETFRTSDVPLVAKLRKEYESDTGHEVPNVCDFGASNILDRCHFTQVLLGFTMKEITGNSYVETAIDKYVNAQQYVVQQAFDRFVRLCYSKGMFQIISNSDARGVGGKFGDVSVRTFVTCGRTLITLARKKDEDEEGLSFVCDDSDPMALSAGLQSAQTDFRTALDMIDTVIANWPDDPEKQKDVFRANDKIGIGF